MSSSKKRTARTSRREAERRADKLLEGIKRVEALAPGGTPDNPIIVSSASQIDVRARDSLCAICQRSVRVDEHVVDAGDDPRLRIARVSCQSCSRRRTLYFRLAPPQPN